MNKNDYSTSDIESTIESTGEFLTDKLKNGKERPWKEYKLKSLKIAGVYRELNLKKFDRVMSCGSFLRFKECSGDMRHPKTLQYADFCRDRLCPTCEWRKSLVISHQVRKVCHLAIQKQKMRFLFLTLTIKNCKGDDLESTLDQMLSGFNRLMKLKRVKSSILGSFRSIEITVNKKDLFYHPHIHVLLAVSTSYFNSKANLYIKQAEWQTLWAQSAKIESYEPIVDIRIVKPKKKKNGIFDKEENNVDDDDNIGSVVAEVSKYATKPNFYDLESDKFKIVIEKLNAALKNRRLIAFGGDLKKIANELKLQDENIADLVNTEGDSDELNQCLCPVCQSEMRDHIYRWRDINYIG